MGESQARPFPDPHTEKSFHGENSKVTETRSITLRKSSAIEFEQADDHRDFLEPHPPHECSEIVEHILSSSTTEIFLGDVVPSPVDAYVIASTAKKCDQIQCIVLNTINVKQLKELAKYIKEFNIMVKFIDGTINLEGEGPVELLQLLHDCGDGICNILLPPGSKIVFGNFVPSPADANIIASIVEKCDPIKQIVVNKFNTRQLRRLAKIIRELDLKVKVLRETVAHQGNDLLKLFRVFRECGDNISSAVRSSLKAANLKGVKLSESDVRVLAFVLKQCSELDVLDIWLSDPTSIETFVSEVCITSLKIRCCSIDSYARPLRHKEVLAICDLIPHVTKQMDLHACLDDKEESLTKVQWKLNSLSKRELKIQLYPVDSEGAYELSWHQPRLRVW